MRDDVQNLKDAIPRALGNQKDLTDTRLREVNAELKSLKTLITQRMNPTATSASVSNYLRPSVSSGSPPAAAPAVPAESASTPEVKEELTPATPAADPLSSGRRSPFNSGMQAKASIPAWQMMASKTAATSSSPAAATTNGTASEGSSSESKEASGSA